VIVEHDQVLVASPQAVANGIRPGMRRASVSALAPDAVLHERDLIKEAAALDSVALALLHYTPEVAHAEESSLLLDVSASLRMFGGRLALTRRVRAAIATLGFTCRIGTGPTAQGAWLLARFALTENSSTCRRVITLATLTRRLNALPYAVLPSARPYLDWLDGIGCRTLGDLRKLPRAGLQRRADRTLLNALDRAYGEAPELFEWIPAPPSFTACLEMPDRIEQADMVLFGARRLLLQLCGWLVARQLAVSRFVLLLEHERVHYSNAAAVPPTPVEISLAEPAWHDEHLVRLLKERLGRLQLTAPVIAIRLEAAQIEAMLPPTESLFPEPGGTPADFNQLLELLTARLGAERVLTPAPIEDHRPEVHNAWAPALTGPHKAGQMPPDVERPSWLLKQPIALLLRDNRPFYGSPLRLIGGPERIECGWWDSALVVRDYFVAQGAQETGGACYWIYRERTGDDPRWYLHGLFG